MLEQKKSGFATLLHAFIYTFAPVKVTSYILIVVIFFLAVYPCSDAAVHSTNDTGYAVVQADAHLTDIGFDLCTPLCTCQCCGTHVQCPSTFLFSSSDSLKKSETITSQQEFVPSLCQSIWQPPKVANSLV